MSPFLPHPLRQSARGGTRVIAYYSATLTPAPSDCSRKRLRYVEITTPSRLCGASRCPPLAGPGLDTLSYATRAALRFCAKRCDPLRPTFRRTSATYQDVLPLCSPVPVKRGRIHHDSCLSPCGLLNQYFGHRFWRNPCTCRTALGCEPRTVRLSISLQPATSSLRRYPGCDTKVLRGPAYHTPCEGMGIEPDAVRFPNTDLHSSFSLAPSEPEAPPWERVAWTSVVAPGPLRAGGDM